MRADSGVVESYPLAGTGSLASRLWTKPSDTVIGFDAHPVDGSFNVISPETRFRISLRVAPTQEPHAAMQAMVTFLESHAPFGAEVHVTPLDEGMGWAMDPQCEATRDAEEALREAFGVDPVNKGEGGSIPFIPELQRIFPHAQVLVTGPEDPVTPLDEGMGWAMDPQCEATRDAEEALREAFGVDPVNKGEGGSIPFIPELQRIFPHAQVLVTGPEDPQSNAHSPNESVSVSGLRNDVVAEALLLDKLNHR